MKTSRAISGGGGLTLIELLVLIVVIVILAELMLQTVNRPKPAYGARCLSNLKQVSIGYVMYAEDNAEKFPMPVSAQNGQTMESRYAGDAVPYFEKIHRYLPGPQFYKLLVCPVDKTRQIATNPNTLNHSNLSYFFNADSQTTNQPAQALLAGDRNLTANGQGIEPGLFITTFKTDINWSSELHPYGGNLAFADGHVESVKKNEINAVFGRQPSATNHLVVP